ncbi:photosystem II reaction center PsbP family protein [Synechocystis salina LEGE 06099]|uniref:photosystem II reaction center PsbP n=1 Tax=Synechocystis salina TaxID=945780 RepID=UPI001880039F|nr:photosystem II reaction center PsbP [Synechocystis salina]MBE9203470.1 photosystem II reaction center PsbP family protein [Synechocystis salina LEGE 06099]
MFKKSLSTAVVLVILLLSFTLTACGGVGIASLQRYSDTKDGYEFLYPNGWIGVDVKGASPGVDVVFRDLIERDENLSVIISEIPNDKTLTDLGTATDVGYRFMKTVNEAAQGDRQAELITAEERDEDGQVYYTLEYRVLVGDNVERHDLASVTTNRGKLITFDLSTAEDRWDTVKNLFDTVASSFHVY